MFDARGSTQLVHCPAIATSSGMLRCFANGDHWDKGKYPHIDTITQFFLLRTRAQKRAVRRMTEIMKKCNLHKDLMVGIRPRPQVPFTKTSSSSSTARPLSSAASRTPVDFEVAKITLLEPSSGSASYLQKGGSCRPVGAAYVGSLATSERESAVARFLVHSRQRVPCGQARFPRS